MTLIGLLTRYKILAKDLAASTRQVTNRPDLKREVDYYKANIGSIKSIDQFLGDQRLYSFAMRAFGLGDMIYAKAYMKKALTEGIDQPNAFSLRLADSRFREFVETFNFARYGAATTSFDRTQEGTVQRHARVVLEEQAGSESEALRLALYFERTAGKMETPFSILADKAAYTVVRTALGLPDAISGTDIDRQATLIGQKLNLADLKDPTKLNAFINRFLGLYEAKAGLDPTTPAVALFQQQGNGIGMNTLMSIQSLRRG
jgi:hypothetical protein